MLADKGDFDRLGADARAVTICKAVGKGFVILDTQEHGDLEPDAHVPWQFWNYLDAAPTLVSRHNGTQGAGRGRREQFRFFAESGQYFLRIAATESWPWSLEKLRLQVNTTPVERPFEPNQQPRAATWLVSDVPIRTSLFPEDDVDWFRLAAAKPGPLVFELTDVPDDLDPMVEIYAADALDGIESHVVSQQSRIGSFLNRVDSSVVSLEERDLQAEARRSRAVDADLADAMVSLATQETLYQAALQVASRISTLSMMNYL